MKKQLQTLTAAIAFAFASLSANAQNVNIPDANFKAALVNDAVINTNSDTEIQVSEAAAYAGAIDVQNLGISDLTGIEAFTNITNLDCSQNSLTSLNTTSNTLLTTLKCYTNQIASLNVSSNPLLTVYWCFDNDLTTLDVSNLISLTQFDCKVNQITALDISPCVNLDYIVCNDNSLTSLNIANGNNINFSGTAFFNNPNLSCIQVDDIAYSNTNWSNAKDTMASYSTNCSFVANFTFGSTVCINSTATFTNTSQGTTGGTTYLWDFGDANTSTLQNPTHAYTLAGAYNVTLTITDYISSTKSSVITVNTANAFGINDTTICLGSDVSLYASGGTSYSWTASNGTIASPTSAITTATPNAVGALTYVVTATNSNGCSANDTAFVTVNSTTAPTVSISSNLGSVVCPNSNVVYTATASNAGTTPTYQWKSFNNIISGETNATYTALDVTVNDSVTCVVTSSNSCANPTSVTSAAIELQVSNIMAPQIITNVACFGGNTGSIDVTTSGGTAPYSHFWSGASSATTEDISSISAGTYNVYISDVNGCSTAINGLVVTQPALGISANSMVTNIVCNGANNGAIDVTVSGGTTPYTYQWSGASTATTEDISSLTIGSYSVLITDMNNCTTNINGLVITQPASGISANSMVTNIVCNGGNNGAIDVTVSGGTAPYAYQWSGASTATTEDINSLTFGSYSVLITDINNCITAINSLAVTQPTAIGANTNITDVSCNGGNNGSIDLAPNGGISPYTFLWSNSSVAEDIGGLSANSYSVTITDANLCTKVIANINVAQPSAVATPTLTVQNNCGNSTLIASNVTGVLTWSDAGSGNPRTVTNPIAYSLTQTVGGCVSATSNAVTASPLTTPTTSAITGNATPNCGAIGAVYSVTNTAGSSYSWTVPSGATIITGNAGPNNSSITVTFGASGGNITVTETNAGGCVGTTNTLVIAQVGCGCTVTIPDAAFKNALVSNFTINVNQNTEIECSEATAYTGSISVPSLSITDLTGIDSFVNATTLDCHNNTINTLNLLANTSLTSLVCYGSSISNLILPTSNILDELICSDNALTAIDVTQLPNLTYFACNSNQISTLDVSQNPNLDYLECAFNSLTSLNVATNTLLTRVWCADNLIQTLNLSANTLLTDIECANNALTSLNIKNTNNLNLTIFDATGNPNLTCIQTDDVTFMNTNFSAFKDATASYSANCAVPLAVDDIATINEDATVYFSVVANDNFGSDGASSTDITVATNPTNGTASVNDNGTANNPTDDYITYTPNANFNGTDVFTYTIMDATGDASTATVNVTINAVNDLPLAVNDNANVNEDASASINVLINDDFGGDGANVGSITIAINATNGIASVDDNGTPNNPIDDKINYTPTADYNGLDAFTYSITDADGDVSSATVNVTVIDVNDAATATNDSYNTPFNTTLNGTTVTVNDNANDFGQTLTVNTTPVVNVAFGTLFLNANGTFSYAPNNGYVGNDSFTYTVCDNGTAQSCVNAVVTITVSSSTLPTATNDNANVTEDVSATISVLTNDVFGADGAGLAAITIATQPSNGFATVDDNGTPTLQTDDKINYSPNADYDLTDSFTYTITDATGDASTATVNITIIPVNDAPVAIDNTSNTTQNTPITFNVTSNDTDVDGTIDASTVDFDNVTAGAQTTFNDASGTFTVNGSGDVTYTPAFNFTGTASASYSVNDNGGATSNIASISITVSQSAPVVNIGGPYAICTGATQVLDAGNAGATYLWSTNETTQTITVSTAGVYSVTATNSGGSSSSNTNVTVNTLPIADAGLDATICAGANTGLAATGGVTYLWTPAIGLSAPNIANPIASPSSTINYSVTVTDANGCVANDNVTVIVAPIAVTSVSINASANNICAGTLVTFTATPNNGGTPTYQWQNGGLDIVGETNATYSSSSLLNNDAITCIMISSLACASPTSAISNSITMIVNSTVIPSITINASANNVCVGTSIIFTASPTNQGASPTYQWKNNGINIAGETAITYTSTTLANADVITCELTSNANCASTTTAISAGVTMIINSAVTASVIVSATSTTVCSGSNVDFTAMPTNGGTTPSYQWKLNNANVGIDSPLYSNNTLANADTIECMMTSNAACVSVATVNSNIIEMTNGNVTPTITINASVNSICTGTSVTFTASTTDGGTTPAFQWKVNGLDVGINILTYTSTTFANNDIVTCVLTSNASCVTTSTATSAGVTMVVTNLPTVPTVALIIQPTCGTPTATIDFTTQAGVEYSVGAGFQVSPTFAGLVAGTYTLTVRNTSNNSCTTNAASTVTINAVPTAPAIPTTATTTQPTCGVPTGTIDFTTQAGVEYSVGGAYQASTTFAGLVPNTYTLTVRSTTDNTCTTNAASTVIINAVPTAPAIPTTATTTQPTCGVPTGTIDFTTQAGVEYSVGGPYQATTTFAGLVANTYTLTVRSTTDNTCTTNAASTVTINAVPTAPTIPTTATTTQPTCGVPTGTIDFTTQAGVEYSVGGAYQATTTFAGLVPNTYTLTVRSTTDNTCTTNAASTVTINAVPTASQAIITGNTNVCPSATTILTASIGVSYLWNTLETSQTVSKTSGTYSVVVTDVNGCTSLSANFTITDFIVLPVFIAGNNNFCAGDSTVLTASGAISYVWSTTATTNAIYATSAGNYSVIGTDANGCNANNNVNITANPLPTANAGNDASICVGSNTTLSGSGGVGYVWSPVTGLSNAAISNPIANPTSTAIYALTVSDANGCSATDSVTITVNSLLTPSVSIASTDTTICAGTAVTFTATIVNGGNTPTMQWKNNGVNIVGETAATYISASIQNGNSITCVITSSDACANPTTATSAAIVIGVTPLINASVSVVSDAVNNTICNGTMVFFIPTPVNGGTPLYQWYKNGVILAGETNANYSTISLINNDVVSVQMVSTMQCVVQNTVSSNNVTITVTPNVTSALTTSITSGNDTICEGVIVSFAATAGVGISNPIIQWQINGNNIPQAIGLNYIASNLQTGDIIRAILTNANECLSTYNFPSNLITMHINAPINYNLAFAASTTTPAAPNFKVKFTNNSPNNNGVKYLWFFGNGATAFAKDTVTYHYPYNGIYSVTLLGIDTVGFCSVDTLRIPSYIVCTGNVAPAATCNHTVNVTTLGPLATCAGSTRTLVVTTDATSPTYQWSNNGVPIGGETQNHINASVNGVYSVTVYNDGTCPLTSGDYTLTFNNQPPTPPIIANVGNLPSCGTGTVTLTSTGGGFVNYLWNTGEIGASIIVSASNYYTVIGTDANGCQVQSLPFTINNSIVGTPNICKVEVDTVINKNYIVWDKTGLDSLAAKRFVIYRETNVVGVFDSIASQPYNNLSKFTDLTSNPSTEAERYKIAVLDTCNGLTLPSTSYKTIYLQVTPGVGLHRNLSWNTPTGYSAFQNYTVYRRDSIDGNFEEIALIPYGTNTYLDVNLTDTTIFLNAKYRIAAESQTDCFGTKTLRTLKTPVSNQSGNEKILGLEDVGIKHLAKNTINLISIAPNPTNGIVTIKINQLHAQLSIVDILGKEVYRNNLTQQSTSIDLSAIAQGVYFVKVTSLNGDTMVKKLVKE